MNSLMRNDLGIKNISDEELISDTLEKARFTVEKMIIDKRKQGYDTYLAELLMMTVPTNIKMAKVTNESKDYHLCKVLFIDIITELERSNKIITEDYSILIDN